MNARSKVNLVLTAASLAVGGAAASAQNLLTNGTFDRDLAGWTVSSDPDVDVSWLGFRDANGSPFSGSAFLNVDVLDLVHHLGLSQCVAVDPGSLGNTVFELGAAIHPRDVTADENEGEGVVRARFFELGGCSGAELTEESAGASSPNRWISVGDAVSVPASARSARVELSARHLVSAQATWFDNVYLRPRWADLSLDMTVSNMTPLPGSLVTYTLEVTNETTPGAIDPVVVFDLQSGMSFDSSVGCVGSVATGASTVTWNVSSLAPSLSTDCDLVVRLATTALGSIPTSAEVSHDDEDPNSANDTSQVSIDVRPAIDLVLAPVLDPERGIPGSTTELLLRLANGGNVAATGTGVVVELPPAMVWSGTGSCEGAVSASALGFDWDPGSVAVGELTFCSVELTADAGASVGPHVVVAAASAFGFELNIGDNQSLSTFTVAAPFSVTSRVDLPDSNPGDGACNTGGGLCTLRAALMETNALAGHDIIQVPSFGGAPFVLDHDAGGSEEAATDLDILDDVVIEGLGAGALIEGYDRLGARDRVFEIPDGAGVEVTLVNLELSGGQAADGGAIYHGVGNGLLEIRDSVLRDSQATNGGALWSGSPLLLWTTEILDNWAVVHGGGVYFDSVGESNALTIERSSLHGNTAMSFGGGLHLLSAPAVTIRDSTLYDNDADVGGALYASVTDAVLANVTVSGNEAESTGGGLHLGGLCDVELWNVTVVLNEAGPGDDLSGLGGGFYVSPGSTLTVANSIVAENRAQLAGGGFPVPFSAACHGTLSSAGHNLVASVLLDADCTVAGDTTGNLLDVPTGLGPLGDNGGPTPTHVPAAGSLALERGWPDGCRWNHDLDDGTLPVLLDGDQRLLPRQGDGDGDGVARCDAGAVEVDGAFFSDGFESGNTSAWSSTVGP